MKGSKFSLAPSLMSVTVPWTEGWSISPSLRSALRSSVWLKTTVASYSLLTLLSEAWSCPEKALEHGAITRTSNHGGDHGTIWITGWPQGFDVVRSRGSESINAPKICQDDSCRAWKSRFVIMPGSCCCYQWEHSWCSAPVPIDVFF